MIETMSVGIHYKNEEVRSLYKKAGIKTDLSSGFDLMNIEPLLFSTSQPKQLVDLGVIIKLPPGFHAVLMPRSSTFSRYSLLQGNSIGLIDQDYCGSKDWWKWCAVWHPIVEGESYMNIPAGTRLVQFFIQPVYRFNVEEYEPPEESRGGFGSTGK
jgi:dUTP pyrophosphatase